MSLLIKALNKAEEKAQAKAEQTQAESEISKQKEAIEAEVKKKSAEKSKTRHTPEIDLGLSLSPTGSTLVDPVSVADTGMQKSDIPISNGTKTVAQPVLSTRSSPNVNTSNVAAKSAANVFSAKGMDSRNQNKTLVIIAGLSLLALIAMGLYYYQFFNQPNVVIPPAPISQSIETQQLAALASEKAKKAIEVQIVADDSNPEKSIETVPKVIQPREQSQEANNLEAATKKTEKKMLDKLALTENEAIEEPANQDEIIEDAPQVKAVKSSEKQKRPQIGDAIASESASIEVTKSNPQAAINPALMSAYEAYNAGNDSEAQKLYKQVLQRDVRNVDALLGLGAIATRQGRIADANGWYSKVLEVEPRNSMAQSALLDNQLQISGSQGNTQDAESRLKNMLAKQPNDANLYVALGNLYAEQNQWASAQQAYFDAYSLNGSADNAFNLAVSLDQMGKPKLALPYYRRALEQASSSSNIDIAALEARIAAIQ